MKRICAALLLVAVMAGAAWGADSIGRIKEQEFISYVDTLASSAGSKSWKTKTVSRETNDTDIIVHYQHKNSINSVITFSKTTSSINGIIFLVEPPKADKPKEKEIQKWNSDVNEVIGVSAFLAMENALINNPEILKQYASAVGLGNEEMRENGTTIPIDSLGIVVKAKILPKPLLYFLTITLGKS